MDTLPRDGARIEIQALRLCLYKLARKLNADIKKKSYYYRAEQKLKNKVREEFWDGEILADGIYPKTLEVDSTIRPNIFLTAYLYPELLSRKEWKTCFDNAINKLWLSWGGFATIDKNNPGYYPYSTGENPSSYHQGDSWYFVNNLAAITLFRLDKDKYKNYIEEILAASVDDLLWFNTLAASSEISAAEENSHKGCFNQAWSAATYMEMISEMQKELMK
jgi:glycogen debranching enzyme